MNMHVVRDASQRVLPLLPDGATPIGPVAGLLEDGERSVVFVSGQATFSFAADNEFGRRLTAVQLVEAKIATVGEVMAAFEVTQSTLWRWRKTFATVGPVGLLPGKTGPKGPSKLTEGLAARIRDLDGQGLTLARIAAATGVSTDTVRAGLGRTRRAGGGAPALGDGGGATDGDVADVAGDDGGVARGDADPCGDVADHDDGDDDVLRPVPPPRPRAAERQWARTGLMEQAPVVFTEGSHLPLAGVLLILPALAATGLIEAFTTVFGKLRNGFYGLTHIVLTMLFLALIREPRAEGATRVCPADLGRVLGLDRAPEVKTLRRKLAEMADRGLGSKVQHELAATRAAIRPDVLGFLHVDGHTRAYAGKRDLPKAHIARTHMIARATGETHIADGVACPLLVVPAAPGVSLASELTRLVPDMRAIIGDERKPTVIFDRGGYSPACFATLIDAGLHILTYRKGSFEPLDDDKFTVRTFIDPDGVARTYDVAETVVELATRDNTGRMVTVRQIHKRTHGGIQIPILASDKQLDAAEACWRLAARWRHENYFKYARNHFALDALDSYADLPDDGDRPAVNPAKKQAAAQVDRAKAQVTAARVGLAQAVDDATEKARRPGSGGKAIIDPAASDILTQAENDLAEAKQTRRETPSHLPLRDVRPNARILCEQRKLITHSIRAAAYTAETALAGALGPYYARADDEARALLREAFTLTGDMRISGDTLHVTLNAATAPRRTRALAALCQELTATETTYPGTDLKISYAMKTTSDHA